MLPRYISRYSPVKGVSRAAERAANTLVKEGGVAARGDLLYFAQRMRHGVRARQGVVHFDLPYHAGVNSVPVFRRLVPAELGGVQAARARDAVHFRQGLVGE